LNFILSARADPPLAEIYFEFSALNFEFHLGMSNFESFKLFFSPEWILIGGILTLILLPLLGRWSQRVWPGAITLVISIFALIAIIATPEAQATHLFNGLLSFDPLGQFAKVFILCSVIVAVILSASARELENTPRPEYYAFLLTLALGLGLLSIANHLLMIYLSLEISSLVSYVLAGFLAGDRRSNEAGLKYVLYGGVASAVMIFGMSLLFGVTGSLALPEIREFLVSNPAHKLTLLASVLMIFVGLGYKISAAPFHMWAPDVYEGAPMPITAFLSVASKAAGLIVLMRFLVVGFVPVVGEVSPWARVVDLDWQILVAALSAVTMTVGNLLAIQQTNIKRFLAYSSIAHAGYMFMAVAANSRVGVEAVLFYLAAYFLMNFGAFLVASVVANQFKTEEMSDYKGLVCQSPFGAILALTMTIFLFSLTGIPPFAGFVGKWYVFKAVIDANLVWLAVVGIINSVISLFFYVRLIKVMLVDDKTANLPVVNTRWSLSLTIGLFAGLSLYFGIFFQPIVKWAQAAAVMFR
jgi:NADH-quinone oxidoreductase subunit N